MVVFRFPIADDLLYLKRIVAVGGDRVETRQGRLWINDKPVARRDTGRFCQTLGPRKPCRIREENLGGRLYLVASRSDETDFSRRVVVPPDHVFVLGDNRDRSADSRHYGAISNGRLIRAFPVHLLADRPPPASAGHASTTVSADRGSGRRTLSAPRGRRFSWPGVKINRSAGLARRRNWRKMGS